MIEKDKIIKVIESYYLNGLTEQVRFKVKDKKLLINFTTILKDCIGEINTDWDMENCELGIYDSSQLYKLIKIVKDPLQINVIKKGNICAKLEINDSSFELSYHLADLGLISEGKLSNELPDPLVSLDLSPEFIDKFIKGHNALEKAETFTLKTKIDKFKVETVEFIIGLTDKFSNKITFSEPTKTYSELPNFVFRVSNFREIISNSKNSKMTMFIYSMGIIRIDVLEGDVKLKYFLVPNKQ